MCVCLLECFSHQHKEEILWKCKSILENILYWIFKIHTYVFSDFICFSLVINFLVLSIDCLLRHFNVTNGSFNLLLFMFNLNFNFNFSIMFDLRMFLKTFLWFKSHWTERTAEWFWNVWLNTTYSMFRSFVFFQLNSSEILFTNFARHFGMNFFHVISEFRESKKGVTKNIKYALWLTCTPQNQG